MQAQQAAYEAALSEERRIRQENEQKQVAEMAQMYNYIRTLSVQMGKSHPSLPCGSCSYYFSGEYFENPLVSFEVLDT